MIGQIMEQMMGHAAASIKSENVFEIIMRRITETIDKHIHFQRVDDVMNKSNPFAGMEDMIRAQVQGAQGEKETWKKDENNKKECEEAFEDKGRMHVTRVNSLTPAYTLFTSFNYVCAADAASKDEVGMWTVIVHIRDTRLSEKYGTKLKSFSGSIFSESAFSTMLEELSMMLRYIIEVDNLDKPVIDNGDKIDLCQLGAADRINLRLLVEKMKDDCK